VYGKEYHNSHTSHNSQIYSKKRPDSRGTSRIVHNGKNAARMFDVGSIDASEIQHLLKVVVEHGDNLSLTLTSDGGALSITILSGDTRHTAYAATAEQFYVRAHDLLETVY